MMSVIQPIALDLTNGDEIQLLMTAGAAARIRDYTEGAIDLLVKPYLERKELEGSTLLVRLLALSVVQWSDQKRRWVYDPRLSAESDEDLVELIEIAPAIRALHALLDRSNTGLPRMPPPGRSETVANPSTNPASETAPKPNGSASGLAHMTQESAVTNSGT